MPTNDNRHAYSGATRGVADRFNRTKMGKAARRSGYVTPETVTMWAAYVVTVSYTHLDVYKRQPYRDQMRANLAEALGVPVENVGVKATTTEHLGFEGREEGISATAVCLLCRCR